MKHLQLFEQFINESISFDKKGIKAKLEDKVITIMPSSIKNEAIHTKKH